MKDQFGPVDGNRARAKLVSITSFRRTLPWRATVEYARYGGLMDGEGAVMTLERVGGVWIVRSRTSSRIS